MPDTEFDRRAVAEIVLRINDAWRQGRYDELNTYFHPDVVVVPPGFSDSVVGRESCVQSYKDFTAAATIHEFVASEPVVEIWGETTVATCGFTIAYEMSGQSHREVGTDILVFTRERDTWLVVWRTLVANPVKD